MDATAPLFWPWQYPPAAKWLIEPPGLYRGATLWFCKLFEFYPATDWTLNYGLVPQAGQLSGPILFSSVPLNGGNVHLVTVPAAITAAWAAQKYEWQLFARVTSQGATNLGIDPTTNVYLSTGQIVVFPNLTVAGAVDSRGKWQKILAEIEAMILATAGDSQQEVSIGRGTIAGQSIKGWTRQELIAFHDYALHMAGNETRIRNRRGGAPNPRVKYGVVGGSGAGWASNGFPDIFPVA